MKMKTYIVSSLAEAVTQIKKDLGSDAVILSTKKHVGGKWFDRGRPKLEVTAAIDVPSPVEAVSSAPVLGQTLRMISKMTEEQMDAIKEELRHLRESVSALSDTTMTKQTEQRKADLQNSVQVETQPVRVTEPEQQTLSQGESASGGNHKLMSAHDIGSVVLDLSHQLLWHRVGTGIVKSLSGALAHIQASSVDDIKEHAAAWLMDQLPSPEPLGELLPSDRLIALLGPTGSGKTTTLVKMASRLAIEQKKSIAFVTLDHFRIGAEEQLKKYANVLQVPMAMAVNKKEFLQAIQRFSHVDAIFIDTAGRSPYDTAGVAQMENSLHIEHPIWKSLVIPAQLQDPDLSRVLNQFKPLNYQKLVITKLDETVCLGTAFNASFHTQCPLAYFTTGQNVPDDIEPATLERVVDCLLNISGDYEVMQLGEDIQYNAQLS